MMALHLGIYSSGSVTEIDLSTNILHSFKLKHSDSQPSVLTFTASGTPQSEIIYAGITYQTFLAFWDDSAGTSRKFFGKVIEIQPGNDSRQVEFTAIDPTGTTKFQIMNADWTSDTVPAARAYPRFVFNATIDNDDDKTWEILNGATVGQILRFIFDKNILPLRRANAAPAASDAYDATEMDALTFVPQEKIVIQEMAMRDAVEMILKDWYPTKRIWFDPVTLQWRLRDRLSLTPTTITLNDPSETHPTLACRVTRSLVDRYSAVSIYGPEAMEYTDITMSTGGLTDISDGPVLETINAGTPIYGKNKWQITDPTKRRILRWLNLPFYAPQIGQSYGSPATGYTIVSMVNTLTWSPTFMVKFPIDNMGDDSWLAIEGWIPWTIDGIIDFRDEYIFRANPNPPVVSGLQTAHYVAPTDVRLVYCTPAIRLEVRYPPTSGVFAGDVYDNANLSEELRLYDELLAVGYEWNEPVTTVERLAQYQEMAYQIWRAKSKMGYTGFVTLEGADWRWFDLTRAINIASVDDDGDAFTTGWEHIDAFVTEVEYDFSEQTTNLTINNDLSQQLGVDLQHLKRSMHVHKLTRFFFVEGMQNDFPVQSKMSALGRNVSYTSSREMIQYISGYADLINGQVQGASRTTQTIMNGQNSFATERNVPLSAREQQSLAGLAAFVDANNIQQVNEAGSFRDRPITELKTRRR